MDAMRSSSSSLLLWCLQISLTFLLLLTHRISDVGSDAALRGSDMIVMEASNVQHKGHLKRGARAPGTAQHTVVFARKQLNLDQLERKLHAVSDPSHALYGRFLTNQQVAVLTAYPAASFNIKKFLTSIGARIIRVTQHDDYFFAAASIETWELHLKTEFYEFTDLRKHRLGRSYYRAVGEYSLPKDIAKYVHAVFNTIHLPNTYNDAAVSVVMKDAEGDEILSDAVYPALLNQVYQINNNTGSQHTTQAVYATDLNTFGPNDLEGFQEYFSLPLEGIANYYGGTGDDTACHSIYYQDEVCSEGNLDVQYIIAVAQNIPTTWYYWGGEDPWLDWITEVADMPDPPTVFSLSYGSYENAFEPSYLRSFSIEAQKLGVQGVSLFASTGDAGVGGFLVVEDLLKCDYYPSFPASCPYVTAVGGTQGPEEGSEEVACSTATGSSITTGGGFSDFFHQFSYQSEYIADYFRGIDEGTTTAPVSGSKGFNASKRGYPDVSVMANKFIILSGDKFIEVSGTSASTPVVAAMASLVNSARVEAGQPTLGWLNPALYQYADNFTNDVTSGNNRCLSETSRCCTEGFYSSSGWDPVTGLGSIDFDSFLSTLTSDAVVSDTFDDDFEYSYDGDDYGSVFATNDDIFITYYYNSPRSDDNYSPNDDGTSGGGSSSNDDDDTLGVSKDHDAFPALIAAIILGVIVVLLVSGIIICCVFRHRIEGYGRTITATNQPSTDTGDVTTNPVVVPIDSVGSVEMAAVDASHSPVSRFRFVVPSRDAYDDIEPAEFGGSVTINSVEEAVDDISIDRREGESRI